MNNINALEALREEATNLWHYYLVGLDQYRACEFATPVPALRKSANKLKEILRSLSDEEREFLIEKYETEHYIVDDNVSLKAKALSRDAILVTVYMADYQSLPIKGRKKTCRGSRKNFSFEFKNDIDFLEIKLNFTV